MPRKRRSKNLYLAFPIIGVVNAQTLTETIDSNGRTVVVVFTSDPTQGAFLTTIATLTRHPSSTPISKSITTPTPVPLAATETPDSSDGIVHTPSPVPVIAGSLAGFIAILAAILVLVVVRCRKRRRSSLTIHHPFGGRINISARDDDSPSSLVGDSRRNRFSAPFTNTHHPASEPSNHSKYNTFAENHELGTQLSLPRVVITEDRSRSPSHRISRHGPIERQSSVASRSSLNSGGYRDIKVPILDGDTQSPAIPPPPPSIIFSEPESTTSTSSSIPSTSRSTHSRSASLSLSLPHDSNHARTTFRTPSPLPPEIRRQNLIALLEQQRDNLLASGSDESVLAAVELLEEQITSLRRQAQGSAFPSADAPPAYDSVR